MKKRTTQLKKKHFFVVKSLLLLLIVSLATSNYSNAQKYKGVKYEILKESPVYFAKTKKIRRNIIIIRNKTGDKILYTNHYNKVFTENEGNTIQNKKVPIKNWRKEKFKFTVDHIDFIICYPQKNDTNKHFKIEPNNIAQKLLVNSQCYNTIIPAQNCVPKYNILYDIGNDQISYYKNGIYKKRINPYVNSILRFTYINYNSLSDSITLKAEFIDRNLEDEELFANIIKEGLEKPDEDELEDVAGTVAGVEGVDAEGKRVIPVIFNCPSLLEYLKDDVSDKKVEKIEKELILFINKGVFNNIDSLTNYIKTCKDLTEGQSDTLFSILEKLNRKKLSESIDSLNAFHTRIQIETGAVDEKQSNLSEICKNLNISMKSVDTDILKLYKGDNLNFKKKFLEAYKQVYNYNPPLYNWLQIKNNDIVKLNFEYYSNKRKKSAHELELFTSGGLKIDFSTGFVVHGLIDENYLLKDSVHFRDNEANIYSVRPNDTITVTEVHQNVIKNDPSGDFNYAFSVMSHLYFRTGTRVNIGLTTGFTTNLQSDFRFLAGASLLLGSEKRWVISGGVICGERTVLSDGFEVGDVYSADNNTPPTKQKMDYNLFFGISYNLGGVKLSK
ncbi:MAG: hypothetical protein KAR57_00830 [Bacteroidales bacterium]|nr:hypothetical protein [Bacteroidales bacterium]